MRSEITGNSPIVLGHVSLMIDQLGFVFGATRVTERPILLGDPDVTVRRPVMHLRGA